MPDGAAWGRNVGYNGSFTMTKPADSPDGSPTDITVARAWSSVAITVTQFQGEINATKSNAGRQVFESANGSPSDTCWFQSSIYTSAALSGGGWYVGYYSAMPEGHLAS